MQMFLNNQSAHKESVGEFTSQALYANEEGMHLKHLEQGMMMLF